MNGARNLRQHDRRFLRLTLRNIATDWSQGMSLMVTGGLRLVAVMQKG